jgi:hypothetical protein
MGDSEFKDTLLGVLHDAVREGTPAISKFLGLPELTRAFLALREHVILDDGLFAGTKPTDQELVTIFTFLVIP